MFSKVESTGSLYVCYTTPAIHVLIVMDTNCRETNIRSWSWPHYTIIAWFRVLCVVLIYCHHGICTSFLFWNLPPSNPTALLAMTDRCGVASTTAEVASSASEGTADLMRNASQTSGTSTTEPMRNTVFNFLRKRKKSEKTGGRQYREYMCCVCLMVSFTF